MAKVNPIKAIGFDIGGVILESEQGKLFSYCQEAFAVPIEGIKKAIWQNQPALERGDIKIAEFWQKVTSQLGVDYDLDKDLGLWLDHYIEDSPINRSMLSLSDVLRKNGYKTGILSNTHEEHIQLNLDRGIFEHFDVAYFSNRIHARKPETEAFQTLWKGLGVEQRELAFIDDNLENIAAATSLGIHAIKFTNNDEVIQHLVQLEIKVR